MTSTKYCVGNGSAFLSKFFRGACLQEQATMPKYQSLVLEYCLEVELKYMDRMLQRSNALHVRSQPLPALQIFENSHQSVQSSPYVG
jgi:hypothetical protein